MIRILQSLQVRLVAAWLVNCIFWQGLHPRAGLVTVITFILWTRSIYVVLPQSSTRQIDMSWGCSCRCPWCFAWPSSGKLCWVRKDEIEKCQDVNRTWENHSRLSGRVTGRNSYLMPWRAWLQGWPSEKMRPNSCCWLQLRVNTFCWSDRQGQENPCWHGGWQHFARASASSTSWRHSPLLRRSWVPSHCWLCKRIKCCERRRTTCLRQTWHSWTKSLRPAQASSTPWCQF